MTNSKKRIGIYLALIMLFNILTPLATPITVSANPLAPPNMEVEIARDRGMITGGDASWVPRRIVGPTPGVPTPSDDQVVVNFPVRAVDDFELTFVTDEGWDVRVFVRGGDFYGYNAVEVVFYVDFTNALLTPPISFQMYTAPAENNWVGINTYLAPGFARPTTTAGMVVGTPGPPPDNNFPPQLIITEGHGFSFRVYGREIHMMYLGGQFYFAMDEFTEGNIYEFNLHRLNPLPPGEYFNVRRPISSFVRFPSVDPSTIHVNMGFSGLAVRPFANASVYNAGSHVPISPVPTQRRYNLRTPPNVIRHSRYPSAIASPPIVEDMVLNNAFPNEFPRWPANPEEPLGFVIEFDVPTAVGSNTLLPSFSGNAELFLDGAGVPNPISFRLFDIFNPAFTDSTAFIYPLSGMGFTVVHAEHIAATGTAPARIQIDLLIEGETPPWLPSLFYDGAAWVSMEPENTARLTDDPVLFTRASNLPPTYTLLHYEIEIIDGRYYIIIRTPFNIPGEYVVIEGTNINFLPDPVPILSRTHMVNPNAPGGIPPIPVRGNTLGSLGRYFQIFFMPHDEFSPDQIRELERGLVPGQAAATALTGSRTLISQVLWFRGSVNDVTLQAPRHFDVHLDSHAPREGDVTRETGVAEITVSWDIGEVANINNLLARMNYPNAASPEALIIDYDFSWTLNPYDEAPGHFARVRATIVTGGAIGVPPSITFELIDTIDHPFDAYTWRGISLVQHGQTFVSGESPEFGVTSLFGYVARIQFRVNTYHELHIDEGAFPPIGPIIGPVRPPAGLRFPAIHFMNVGAVNIGNRPGYMNPIEIPVSDWRNFTLSDFDDPMVPPPQHLTADNPIVLTAARGDTVEVDGEDVLIDQVSFDISWEIPSRQFQRYLVQAYGLFPYDPTVQGEGAFGPFDFEMTIYLSQDENFMMNRFAHLIDTDAQEHHEVRRGYSPDVVVAAPVSTSTVSALSLSNYTENNIIRLGTINDEAPNMTASGFTEPRDALRDGRTLAITGLELTESQWSSVTSGTSLAPYRLEYTIDGLDKNQRYFMFVDFIVTHHVPERVQIRPGSPNVTNPAITIVEASLLSNMDGILMPDDPEIPDGFDRDPPAIDLRTRDVTMSSAILYWNRIHPLPMTDPMYPPLRYTQTIEYEIIRIRDQQMSEAQLNNRVPFADIWNAISGSHEDIIAMRTVDSATRLEEWTGTGWGGAPDSIVIYPDDEAADPYSDPIEVQDRTLVSNSLYFYYVRVVRTVVGPSAPQGISTFSIWDHETVTTDIAGAPINLRIESGPERVFDRMHEVMVSFEAPILHAGLANVLGRTAASDASGVMFEYQLRRDDGDWLDPVYMGVPFLMQHATPVLGGDDWTWFLYHIRGLTAGETYSIRVRMVEYQFGAPISHSMWSNTVIWNTDTDPEADERDRFIRDWIDYLRRRLNELLRQPHWVIRQDPGVFAVYYRTEMFNDTVARASGGHILLPVEDARTMTYYIPYAAFRRAWDAELSFVLNNPYGNMRLMLPARAVDLNENDQVIETNISIRRGEWNDYMVRLNVNWSNPEYIQGEETFSHAAEVGVDLVAVTQVIGGRGGWEARLFESLAGRVEELATDPQTLEFVRNAVIDAAPMEDVSRYMVHIVENVATMVLAREVNDNFVTLNNRNRTASVQRLDRGMAISAIADPQLASLTAYQSNEGSLWNNISTLAIGGSRGIFSSQPGFFVFTGREVRIQGIEQVAGGPVATGVVARHGLDDFFGRGEMNVNQAATRGQLLSSVARMMGAPRGADAVPWLRANGVTATAAGSNNPITNQAALQLIMQVYEAQTGTRMDSIRITNFAAVNNLPGLDERNRTAVAAAVQLGLVSPQGFQPGAQMSVGTLLEVLAVLDRLVGL